jgi:large subunit ribosomal protein L31
MRILIAQARARFFLLTSSAVLVSTRCHASGGVKPLRCFMQKDIHPEYAALEATCSCGNVIKTKSTRPGSMYLDVCSACHPFYTGKQKVVDTGGRIDRFNKRFGSFKK